MAPWGCAARRTRWPACWHGNRLLPLGVELVIGTDLMLDVPVIGEVLLLPSLVDELTEPLVVDQPFDRLVDRVRAFLFFS